MGIRSLVSKFIPSYCGQIHVPMVITLSASRLWHQLGTRFDIRDVDLRHPISRWGLVVESMGSTRIIKLVDISGSIHMVLECV